MPFTPAEIDLVNRSFVSDAFPAAQELVLSTSDSTQRNWLFTVLQNEGYAVAKREDAASGMFHVAIGLKHAPDIARLENLGFTGAKIYMQAAAAPQVAPAVSAAPAAPSAATTGYAGQASPGAGITIPGHSAPGAGITIYSAVHALNRIQHDVARASNGEIAYTGCSQQEFKDIYTNLINLGTFNVAREYDHVTGDVTCVKLDDYSEIMTLMKEGVLSAADAAASPRLSGLTAQNIATLNTYAANDDEMRAGSLVYSHLDQAMHIPLLQPERTTRMKQLHMLGATSAREVQSSTLGFTVLEVPSVKEIDHLAKLGLKAAVQAQGYIGSGVPVAAAAAKPLVSHTADPVGYVNSFTPCPLHAKRGIVRFDQQLPVVLANIANTFRHLGANKVSVIYDSNHQPLSVTLDDHAQIRMLSNGGVTAAKAAEPYMRAAGGASAAGVSATATLTPVRQQGVDVSMLNGYQFNQDEAKAGKLIYSHEYTPVGTAKKIQLTSSSLQSIMAGLHRLGATSALLRRDAKYHCDVIDVTDPAHIAQLSVLGVAGAVEAMKHRTAVATALAAPAAGQPVPLDPQPGPANADISRLEFIADKAKKRIYSTHYALDAQDAGLKQIMTTLYYPVEIKNPRIENVYDEKNYTSGLRVVVDDEADLRKLSALGLKAAQEIYPVMADPAALPAPVITGPAAGVAPALASSAPAPAAMTVRETEAVEWLNATAGGWFAENTRLVSLWGSDEKDDQGLVAIKREMIAAGALSADFFKCKPGFHSQEPEQWRVVVSNEDELELLKARGVKALENITFQKSMRHSI